MSTPTAVGVDDALETLVRQFSDPLACLRELIQNSLDAGSRQIDVAMSLAEGVMTLEVQDQGEGMNRQIIDTKLTRLFASSKDGDFTKIGRFGIGFVSVFALEPDAVCVDTGRGGEHWRVLFRKDRTFARIALDEPVAGTRVRIIKAVTPEVFADLRTRALDVLRYWCKHVEGEIFFEGTQVSGPLGLENTPVQVRHQEEGTEVLVGIPQDFRTVAGFYNKGLTLFEGKEGGLPGLAFKVSSRYLEHTLTRDNVLHDDNFQKAMDIVERLAGRPLHEALFERLVKGGSAQDWRALSSRLRLKALPEVFLDRPVFPAEGGALSIKALRRLVKERVYYTVESDPLSRACHKEGAPVLLVGSMGPEISAAMAEACDRQPTDLQRHFVLPGAVEAEEEVKLRPVCALLVSLLPDVKLAALVPGHVPNVDAVAVAVAKLDEPTPMAEVGRLEGGFLSRKRTLVLNVDHAAVAALLPLAEREPELCAWLLARLFYLNRGSLDAAREDLLLDPVVARRQARVAK